MTLIPSPLVSVNLQGHSGFFVPHAHVRWSSWAGCFDVTDHLIISGCRCLVNDVGVKLGSSMARGKSLQFRGLSPGLICASSASPISLSAPLHLRGVSGSDFLFMASAPRCGVSSGQFWLVLSSVLNWSRTGFNFEPRGSPNMVHRFLG